MNDGADTTRELPSGTVTFLFTDIEGSTRLLQSLGDRYPAVLETHHRILRTAITEADGVVVGTEGDSFFAVFRSVAGAVEAAVRIQLDLNAEPWPDGRRVRVRMGIHTGAGATSGGTYVGIDVHRAARIAAAAHGGQVLLSERAAGGLASVLRDGLSVRDLGQHRLRDITEPEQITQLTIAGLGSDFPPLAGADTRKGNLPTPLSSFVGRERALGELGDLVLRSRMVTLTGPGGTGKTTLAVRCGSDLSPRIADGVFLVRLASITNADLVMPTLNQVLGVEDDSSRAPIELAIEHLMARDVLLILDNFEHVLAAAGQVGQLLERTSGLRVLATSREPLGLQGERQYPVPPMETPDPRHLPDLEHLSRVEAISLFVERAAAVRPGFALDAANAQAIAEICHRLDGLPLAIELAAATTKILSPAAILERLGLRLPLLTGESRDAPQRQRTLRDAIAWSYDLLDDRQQATFRRLSVFGGGFTLDAAEALDARGAGDTFETVASLVNKSLLRQVEAARAEPRFVMLETIREFADDELARAGETEGAERRHADHFLAFAERAEPDLTGLRQKDVLDALAADHDNLRLAIERAVRRGWIETAQRLGAALWRFWQVRGHLREGRARLAALSALPSAPEATRSLARAVSALGSVEYWMGDFEAAEAAYRRSLHLVRNLDNEGASAEAMYNLAFAVNFQGDSAAATDLLKQAEATFRRLGDRSGEARALWGQAGFDEGIDEDRALALAEQALAIFRDLGDRFHTGWALRTVGLINHRRGALDEARARLGEGFDVFRESGDLSAMVVFVGLFADLEAQQGHVERAIRLAGAATAARDSTATGIANWISGSDERAALVAQCETDSAAARLWADGQAMTLEQAVAYALDQASV